MKNLVGILSMVLIFLSCKNNSQTVQVSTSGAIPYKKSISSVRVVNLIVDSTLNIRALEIHKEHGVFATSDGRIGIINNANDAESIKFFQLPTLNKNQLPNIRAIAAIDNAIFAINIESPANIYKLTHNEVKIVYNENNERTFYDSMEFWNEQEGIAIGDPTEDCISIIITRNSGKTWEKLVCNNLPKAIAGEAAFAASDTNIAIIGDETWLATGGKASRILYSPDKGKTWEVFDTPIIQGKETTGMYSIDFYDASNGFAIGGDYTNPNFNISNKIRTSDGGKNWDIVADKKIPNYKSCVQYIPNSNAKELVALGFNGMDYSNDRGDNWIHLSDESFYTLRFVNDTVAFAAGQGKISKLLFNRND